MSKRVKRLLGTVTYFTEISRKVTQPLSQRGKKILGAEPSKFYKQIHERGKGSIEQLKEAYDKVFSKKYLLYTNVGISLALSCTGDVLEQKYEQFCDEIDEWDRKRTMHMGISGVVVGVICHYWYQFLDARMPGRSYRVVMKKVVADQLICSPLYIAAFFMTMGFLENKPCNEVWQEMKDKAWRLYAAEWMVWPPAQFINFFWLNPKYRVFYDNLISLGYDVYTSQVKHHD